MSEFAYFLKQIPGPDYEKVPRWVGTPLVLFFFRLLILHPL